MIRIEQVRDLDTAKQMLALYAKENARLHKRLAELTRELAAAKGTKESEQLELELSRLQEQLGAFQRRLFAESSERRSEPKEPEERAPQRGHGPKAQPELPVRVVVIELDADQRGCPACGGELHEAHGLTEDSEEVVGIERHFFVAKIKRQKYRCKCNGALVTAPGPTKLIPGGRYALQFAVQVATDKYADHQPLERQCRIMARQGLNVDSQTLWDQIEALARHLEPTYAALRQYVLGADVIGADETWWRLMQGKSSKRWWAWGITTHDACWYQIDESRSARTAKAVLDGFSGTVLCDGYGAYETVQRAVPGVRLAHCWAHARRKFVEAEPNYPDQCKAPLEMIGELFAIEAGLPNPDGLDKAAALEVRARQREQRSKPTLDALHAWALEQRALPKSGIRKAIEYLLEYWTGLVAFVDDPNLAIDNNRTERALRGMVLGRKNHFGSRSKRGTEVAALFYSLVESAKLCGVDPAAYFLEAAQLAIENPGSVLLPQQLAR